MTFKRALTVTVAAMTLLAGCGREDDTPAEAPAVPEEDAAAPDQDATDETPEPEPEPDGEDDTTPEPDPEPTEADESDADTDTAEPAPEAVEEDDAANEEVGDVVVTVAAAVDGQRVSVIGTATVPDGALIAYELLHLDEFEVTEGHAEVSDGGFEFIADLAGWPAGEVEVWVAFQTILGTAEQPQEVIDLYGEMGENISGPQADTVGDITRVDAVTSVSVS
jgi:hypothetical protein